MQIQSKEEQETIKLRQINSIQAVTISKEEKATILSTEVMDLMISREMTETTKSMEEQVTMKSGVVKATMN